MACGLDDEHRLIAGGRPRRRHESTGMDECFHEQQDRPGGRLHAQKIDYLGESHIGISAQRDEV